MKRHMIALSIFALSLSFLISSWLIADALRSLPNADAPPSESPPPSDVKPLLNQTELAQYLGLNTSQVQELLPYTNEEGDVSSRLPYIQIGSTYYFPRTAVDQWLTAVRFNDSFE